MLKYIPERGDVVWLSLDPQAGREQAGYRPALVLSPAAYNRKVGLAIFSPITSQIKGYPFEVEIPEGQRVSGAVLADHVKSLDWTARRARFLCRIPETVTESVLKKLNTLLQWKADTAAPVTES
jgi:mRNA interferase MazF